MSHDALVTYRCVTGHEIAVESLDVLTEEVALDRGAVVRVCREHGAPIAERSIRLQPGLSTPE